MAIMAWPTLKGKAPNAVLLYLLVGSLLGIPLGVYVYNIFDIDLIKISTSILILFATGEAAWKVLRKNIKVSKLVCITHSKWKGCVTGFFSGALTSSLSTPGPIIMIYLAKSRLSTLEIRASILTFYVFAYGCATFSQSMVVGIDTETWKGVCILLPVILLGVIAGNFLAKKINPTFFRWLVIFMLSVSGLYMLISTL